MPRPFRKGIACHGSMPVRPFSPESFVALYNDVNHRGKLENLAAQYGLYYYDQKGVISSQYGSLNKKLAKIGYFHKSGFESSIEEEISLSYI